MRCQVIYELPICLLTSVFYIHRQQRNYDQNSGGEEDYRAHRQCPQQMKGNDYAPYITTSRCCSEGSSPMGQHSKNLEVDHGQGRKWNI